VVADARWARWLLDARTRRQLEPFFGRARTIGEVAALQREKPNTVLRRVTKFVDAGLLQVVAERSRRGRPVRLYETVAETFFVPFEATSADTLEEALTTREAWIERTFKHAVVKARWEALGPWGTRIYRDAAGTLQVQMAVRPDADASTLDDHEPAVLSAWRDGVYLDFDDAKALQRELYRLLESYLGRGGAHRYVVHVGMAPLDEAD
jgi:hypothetical protein